MPATALGMTKLRCLLYNSQQLARMRFHLVLPRAHPSSYSHCVLSVASAVERHKKFSQNRISFASTHPPTFRLTIPHLAASSFCVAHIRRSAAFTHLKMYATHTSRSTLRPHWAPSVPHRKRFALHTPYIEVVSSFDCFILRFWSVSLAPSLCCGSTNRRIVCAQRHSNTHTHSHKHILLALQMQRKLTLKWEIMFVRVCFPHLHPH